MSVVCVLRVCPQGVYPGGYNAAPYNASDHSLFGSEQVCPYVCVSVRVKGPMRPLILNIDTLVSELHPLILYPPLTEER